MSRLVRGRVSAYLDVPTKVTFAVVSTAKDEESLTVNRSGNVPALLGLPAIVPEDSSKPRPSGSEPAARVHVYGPSPPLTVSEPAYGEPTTPEGSSVPTIKMTRRIADSRRALVPPIAPSSGAPRSSPSVAALRHG